MKIHKENPPDNDQNGVGQLDKAIEYVFGSMNDHERRSFETRLQSNPLLAREVEDLQQGTVELARTAPSIQPPGSLRERLMAQIQSARDKAPGDRQIWQQWRGQGNDRHLVRASADVWETTEFDGVLVRCLAVDEDHDQITMMIRMAAGARYPKHRHGGVEECYVLSGDLRQSAQVMGAGDYEWCDQDSVHGEQWTERGCTLLVHSSRHDEILAG